jgi:hypothetical protein
MVVGGKGAQGQVVVVVRHEGVGGGRCCVVVVGQLLLLSWVREQRCWVMERGGRKWAGGRSRCHAWCKFGPPVRLAFIAAWNEWADQDHSKHKNLPCFVKYGGGVSLNSDRSLNSKKSSFLVTGTATGTGIWRVKILVPVPVPMAVPVQNPRVYPYPCNTLTAPQTAPVQSPT